MVLRIIAILSRALLAEGKIHADDKKKVEDTIDETIKWLDDNLNAEK